MTYMSTAERLVKLHDTMCENIEAMGGTVDPTKTLIEIAGEILNIPPVPVGVSIDTATTCAADKATTSINSPVVFTGKVSAYHDDTTSADVDLIGYLKGATVKFYNGQTLLGSTTTDNNGEYSFSYTPTVAGELSVIAMFEAIEDYKQSSSTAVVITVLSYSDIVMSADKPILSYADGDKATLYAQLVDDNDTPLAIEGVTLTFKKDSTILGTADTDSTGLATLVDGYTSQGVGDVTLSVTDGTFLTKRYEVQDCIKTYMSTYLTGAESMSSTFDFTLPSKFRIEYEYSETTNQRCSSLLWVGESTSKAVLFGKIAGNDSTYQIWVRNGTDIKTIGSIIPNTNTYKSFFVEYDGTTFNFNNDISITDFNGVALSQLIQISGYHGRSEGAVGKGMIRNIKIKPL